MRLIFCEALDNLYAFNSNTNKTELAITVRRSSVTAHCPRSTHFTQLYVCDGAQPLGDDYGTATTAWVKFNPYPSPQVEEALPYSTTGRKPCGITINPCCEAKWISTSSTWFFERKFFGRLEQTIPAKEYQ
ncbi:hypothetical protein Q1695_008983 [Nippostrongylus brasiliensis]|nr:hypothetical protein Q1695_008983 [Nippostrongylus brasiliensis]